MTSDRREFCGLTVTTACVPLALPFTPQSINPCDINCNSNLNDFLYQVDKNIANILKSTDIKDLNTSCLKILDPTKKGTWVGTIGAVIDLACATKSKVDTLTQQVNNINYSNVKLSVNLGCLTEASCSNTGSYTLAQLFELLFSEICKLKSQIGGSTSDINGEIYSPS